MSDERLDAITDAILDFGTITGAITIPHPHVEEAFRRAVECADAMGLHPTFHSFVQTDNGWSFLFDFPSRSDTT